MRHALSKVPEITLFFWIIKILTTAMGESTSDYLVNHFNPYVAVFLGLLGFVVAIVLQFSSRRYTTWIYWLTVLMVAVFGTMAADVIHIVLGVPYIASTIFFAIALIVIMVLWYRTEQTLSIHSIYTRRREIFYWLTVLATFALGTAAGDMTAYAFNLGFLTSGIIFGVVIAVIALAHLMVKTILGREHKHLSRNAVFAFWLAYTFTRPFGASFADWMGKAKNVGGLGWGDGVVSLALGVLILGFVAYLAITHKDIEHHSES